MAIEMDILLFKTIWSLGPKKTQQTELKQKIANKGFKP